MIRSGLAVLALTCLAHATCADGAELKSREFKLMLEPARFAEADPAAKVDDFWEQQLKPLIAQRLDPRKGGGPRHKKRFTPEAEQSIIFKDTDGCVLERNGYIFRKRTTFENGQPAEREVTLKYRTPDLARTAASTFKGIDPKAKSKLEEDITPLIELTSGEATFAQPPSTRSQFSFSVTQPASDDPQSLRDLVGLFPRFDKRLAKAGVGEAAFDGKLSDGKHFTQRGFSGALVDLGAVDSKFELVLWYGKDGSLPQPEIAELSFKYNIDDADAAVVERARKLFNALQQLPPDWTSPAHQTKTEAGLPVACARQPRDN